MYAQEQASEIDSKSVEVRKWLLPFADEKNGQAKLPLTRDSYLELADWTGRVVRQDKKGAIPDHVPLLLESLGIEHQCWAGHVQTIGRAGVRAIGKPKSLRVFAIKHSRKWLSGQLVSEFLYER